MLKLLSHAEQVAAHLRSELLRGRYSGTMPGVLKLQAELGVSRTTIGSALEILEADGLLIPQGVGRPRQILVRATTGVSGLKIGLFPYEPADRHAYDMLQIRHHLQEAGHTPILPSRSLIELEMNVGRIARVVESTEASAWVLWSASSEVLTWFERQSFPSMAYAGQYLPTMRIANVAPGMKSSMVTLIRRLISLGHRRISLLTRAGGKPSYFIEELEVHGLQTGSYNLPDCGPSPEKFRACLDALFAATPPTALLIDQQHCFFAAQHYLARRGLFAPKDVSLVCVDFDPNFNLCAPSVAHFRWDIDAIVRNILRWTDNVSRNKEDFMRARVNAQFIDGGTVGPAPKGR